MAQLISQCPRVQKAHREHPNESESDLAPLKHHMEFFVIIIKDWKPSAIITKCSTIEFLYPIP